MAEKKCYVEEIKKILINKDISVGEKIGNASIYKINGKKVWIRATKSDISLKTIDKYKDDVDYFLYCFIKSDNIEKDAEWVFDSIKYSNVYNRYNNSKKTKRLMTLEKVVEQINNMDKMKKESKENDENQKKINEKRKYERKFTSTMKKVCIILTIVFIILLVVLHSFNILNKDKVDVMFDAFDKVMYLLPLLSLSGTVGSAFAEKKFMDK